MHAEVLFSNFMAEHNYILFLHGCTLLHQTLRGHVPRQQVHLHVCLWSHQDNTNRQAFPCTILTSRSHGTFVIQFLLPSQWWEQWQKLWQDLVHTTAIFHRQITTSFLACMPICNISTAANTTGVHRQQHPIVLPHLLHVRQLQFNDW